MATKAFASRGMLVLGIGVLLALMILATACVAEARDSLTEGHMIYVPIPADVTRADFLNPGDALKKRLYYLATVDAEASHSAAGDTIVVIFLDHEGTPILPDLEQARSAPAYRPSQPPHNLTFSFRSPDNPWGSTELPVLHRAAEVFYRAIRRVYGDPAFSNTVNVRKEPDIPFWGLYSPSTNEILLRDAAHLDVFCHEIIHAFRDDDMVGPSGYEEGMTLAAEVEVFNMLPAYLFWNEHHEYPYDVYYEGLNSDVIGSFRGIFDYSSPLLLLRCQLAGYAWGKVLLENPGFLSSFNRLLYFRALSDPSVLDSVPALFGIAATLQTAVEGLPFGRWYGQQGVFCTKPPEGPFLYQNLSNFVIYLFNRDDSGNESMVAETVINWAVCNFRGRVLDSGNGLTSGLGWISIAPRLPENYRGRIRIVASADGPAGEITGSVLRNAGQGEGVFGVLADDDSGFISIIPLDQPAAAVHVPVVDGAFYAPSLTSVRGRFLAIFTGAEGRRYSRRFNKDAGNYFLLMTDEKPSASRESSPDAPDGMTIIPASCSTAGQR